MATPTILFLSDTRLYRAENQKVIELGSEYMDNYKNNIMEIRKKNAWKTTGRGAIFMGVATGGGEDPEHLNSVKITAVLPLKKDKIVYACNTESIGGLYIKNPLDESEKEGYIIRKKDLMMYEMDYNPVSGDIIASVSSDRLTRTLAMFNENKTYTDILTEGDVLDRNPCFSKVNSSLVYYDSAGYAINQGGVLNGISNRSILLLNLKNGEIDIVAEEPEYDFFKPRSHKDGSLFYLSRPSKQPEYTKTTLKEVIQMPGKLFRAIFGWLNFFTQRYSGESLKQNRSGPIKTKEKSEEQIFIEGNLINVTKSLKENTAAGDSYPGIAPKTWQLIKMNPDGTTETIKKGVLDYTLDEDGTIIYSNGKHIIQKKSDGEEQLLCKINLATGLQIL